MDQKPWYRHLARTNRLIVEARERIENLKARISELEDEELSTGRATARLHRFEVNAAIDERPPRSHSGEGAELPLASVRGARCAHIACGPLYVDRLCKSIEIDTKSY